MSGCSIKCSWRAQPPRKWERQEFESGCDVSGSLTVRRPREECPVRPEEERIYGQRPAKQDGSLGGQDRAASLLPARINRSGRRLTVLCDPQLKGLRRARSRRLKIPWNGQSARHF